MKKLSIKPDNISGKQKTFDIVAIHLLEQGCKSELFNPKFDSSPSCLYRGPNNTKCAVGILLDDKAAFKFEGLNVTNSDELKNHLEDLGHDVQLCVDLQDLHDNHKVVSWYLRLKRIASKYGLNIKVIKDYYKNLL